MSSQLPSTPELDLQLRSLCSDPRGDATIPEVVARAHISAMISASRESSQPAHETAPVTIGRLQRLRRRVSAHPVLEIMAVAACTVLALVTIGSASGDDAPVQYGHQLTLPALPDTAPAAEEPDPQIGHPNPRTSPVTRRAHPAPASTRHAAPRASTGGGAIGSARPTVAHPHHGVPAAPHPQGGGHLPVPAPQGGGSTGGGAGGGCGRAAGLRDRTDAPIKDPNAVEAEPAGGCASGADVSTGSWTGSDETPGAEAPA